MQFWEALAWQTPLSVRECIDRLESHTEEDTFFRWLRVSPQETLLRILNGRSLRLFSKGSPFVRNSFEPYFYGDLSESQGVTVVRGSFRIHPIPLTFVTMWLAGVVTIGGAIFLTCAAEVITGHRYGEGDLPSWVGFVAGPILFTFGTGLVALGWRMGRGQRRRIVRFIETTLQGQRLPAPARERTLFKASLG
ncbi:MAG TPA: hypothetical protein VFO11_01045 [Candidatus Polarisedimenticolaceae bacterium]|nr:hypothetical protein [Candidatus Polarisedimenticolaceae bacterium]